MARPIVALALLAMLTIASAERSLLAHKPSGGMSLHGVAITAQTFYSTNGNGTWVGAQNGAYSTASFATGSQSCLATPVAFTAYATTPAAQPCTMSPAYSFYLPSSVAAAGVPGWTGSVLPSFGLTAVTFPSKSLGIAVGIAPPLATYSTTAVSIATTALAGFSVAGGQMVGTYPNGVVGSPVTPAAIGTTPTILTTIDGANSWTAATGFSTPAATYAGVAGSVYTVTSYPIVMNAAPPALAGATGVAYAGAILGVPPATLTPVDLNSVYCVSRSLCFAAGGFLPSSLATANTVAAGAQTAAGSIVAPALVAASSTFTTFPQFGQILRSTNGGSYWTYTSLPTNVAPSNPLCQYNQPPNVGASLCPVPGLLGIAADASGKHVYAVGAGSTPLLNPGDIKNNAVTTVATFGTPAPVILYSGNSGASYTVQTAPTQANYYVLNAVAVLRGTMAFAAGGNPFGTQGAISASGLPTSGTAGTPAQTVQAGAAAATTTGNAQLAATPGVVTPLTNAPTGTTAVVVGNVGFTPTPTQGTIVATNNGGFSWVLQSLPSFNYTCTSANTWGASAPGAVTSIVTVFAATTTTTGGFCSFAAATGLTAAGAGVGSINWQAYQPQAVMRANTIPAINGLGFTSSLGNYNGWAVGDSGYIIQTAFKQNILVNSITQPMTTWTVVTGSAIGTTAGTGAVYLSTGYLNLFGITWDNSLTGYIYGQSLILSTHNAGVTWAVESPNTMIIAQPQVVGLATVPTTY